MRSKFLKLSVIAVLLLSFAAIGCSEETCKNLLSQLESLQNQIIDVANKRREMDAKGTPGTANEAAQLQELEAGLRGRFAETAARYIAKGCKGDVPSLPLPNPVTETQFE